MAVLRQGGVEHLDIVLSHIAHYPLIKDVIEELPVPLGADTPWSQAGPLGLRRNYHRTPEIRPVNDMLNRRKELHVMASYRFEEGIYLLSPTLAK